MTGEILPPTVTVILAVPIQLPEETSTEYVVVPVGVMLIEALVCPVDQE